MGGFVVFVIIVVCVRGLAVVVIGIVVCIVICFVGVGVIPV